MTKFRNERTCSHKYVAKCFSECQWIDKVHFFEIVDSFTNADMTVAYDLSLNWSPIRNLMNLEIVSR